MPFKYILERIVLLTEIAVGLALHLDPEVLLLKGASSTGNESTRVRGLHFFVCVAHDLSTKQGRWIPAFGSDGPARILIPKERKVGHEKWRSDATCVHPSQVWDVPDSAIAEAAHAANDLSRQGRRNRVRDAGSLPLKPLDSAA